MGTTFAYLQPSGTSPMLQKFSKIICRGSEITYAHTFNILECNSFGPEDFVSSKNIRCLCTTSTDLRLGVVLKVCSGPERSGANCPDRRGLEMVSVVQILKQASRWCRGVVAQHGQCHQLFLKSGSGWCAGTHKYLCP